jgi:glycosyltransferase involved in cell wall biosynthesis
MTTADGKRLHLLHVFPTFEVGGAQIRFTTIANGFGRRYRHSIVAMNGDLAAASRLDKAIDYQFPSIIGRKTSGVSFANLRLYRAFLRSSQPDLLLTYNWGAIEWALANRWHPLCRNIHFEDGFSADESPTKQRMRRILLRRLALSGPTRIVVPSYTLFAVATGLWGFAATQVMHLPNGIDCAKFGAPPDRSFLAKLGLPDAALTIGTVATLRAEKNLCRLLRAFAALRRNRADWLVIIGDGPERDAIEAEANRLGVAERTILTGAIDRPERLLGRFDVFALSSDTEQMPYSVLEAMAAGLPIVATDVGDLKDMVARANKPFIVPRDDEARFTASLDELLRDAPRRAAIGRSNQHNVGAKYGVATMFERYATLFADEAAMPCA